MMFKKKGAERRIGKIVLLLVLVIISNGLINGFTTVKAEENPKITLFARGKMEDLEIFAIMQEQLAKIGIELFYCTCDCSNPIQHMLFGGQDMSILRLGHLDKNADFSYLYESSSYFNYPTYNPTIDYNDTLKQGINDWYLNYGRQILDEDERIEHYWNWEQYYMDKLLIYQPLFSKNSSTIGYWDNLLNYNHTDGIVQSWGKMVWNGTHINQGPLNEVVMGISDTTRYNTLRYSDWTSQAPYQKYSTVQNLCMDPLIWRDADGSFWSHLAKEIHYINNTHLRISLRENILWQNDPEGLFTNETFDARDVYFTYYYLSKQSPLFRHYNWLKEIEIIDDFTIDFFIDTNELTQENEPFAWINNSLTTKIFPEHYLNQTQLVDGITPDVTHPSWAYFSWQCFGTGLCEIKSIDNDQIVLQQRPNSWYINTSITNDPRLNWINRFGNYSNGLEILRVRKVNCDSSTVLLRGGYVDIGYTTDIGENQVSTNDGIDIQTKPAQFMISLVYSLHPERANISSNEYLGGEENITKGLALRKAVSYAIDRAEIIGLLYYNEYSINDYPIYPNLVEWCNPNIIKYTRDLDKAKYYMSLLGFNFDKTSLTIGLPNTGIGIFITLLITTSLSMIRRKQQNKKIGRKK